MRQLEDILLKIRECVERYDNLPLEDYKEQSEILKALTSNLFYLERYRVEAYEKWLSVYYNCDLKTNAARSAWADNEVKERYLIKRVMTAAYKVVDSVRSTISIYKKEQ